MEERPFVPENMFFQGCYNPAYEEQIRKCKDKCFEYNKLNPNDRETQNRVLQNLLGTCHDDTVIVPPFWCDYGYNIHVGCSFYANHNTVVQDGLPVRFGDNVFIGPNCTFTTAEHPVDPELRKKGVEIAKSITVGNNVWIGAGSIVLAGATIGDNAVIGAGSIVKGNIPPDVIAVGVPCKVKRKINEKDKTAYPFYSDIR